MSAGDDINSNQSNLLIVKGDDSSSKMAGNPENRLLTEFFNVQESVDARLKEENEKLKRDLEHKEKLLK
jgi:hypothetical protein